MLVPLTACGALGALLVSAKPLGAALHHRLDLSHVAETHFSPKNLHALVDLRLVDTDRARGGVQVTSFVPRDGLPALGARGERLAAKAIALRLTLAVGLGELACRVVHGHGGARRLCGGPAAAAVVRTRGKTEHGEGEE